jgi:hypothetical protein
VRPPSGKKRTWRTCMLSLILFAQVGGPALSARGRPTAAALLDIMCLYQYLYFSSCQHSELTLVTYCGKAKSLSQAERDEDNNISADSLSPRIHHLDASAPRLATSSSASNYSALHSQSQQQQNRNMAALSASHGHTVTGRASIPFDSHQQVTQRAAVRVPPDALTVSPKSLPSSILRHVLASDHDEASDDATLSSSGDSHGMCTRLT